MLRQQPAQLTRKSPFTMHEIICPHCSKAFKIDEAGYADILKQVRDGAFEQQLHERLELAEQDKRNAVELAQAQVARETIGVRLQLILKYLGHCTTHNSSPGTTANRQLMRV